MYQRLLTKTDMAVATITKDGNSTAKCVILSVVVVVSATIAVVIVVFISEALVGLNVLCL